MTENPITPSDPSDEMVPDNRNRVAQLIGLIFHPYFICIPTLFIVMSDYPVTEIISWSVLILAMLLIPVLIVGVILTRQHRHIYQRKSRGPIYVVGWISVLVCFVVLSLLHAPEILRLSLFSLIVWLPLQLLFNTYVTKISAHTGVVAGCITGLYMLGKLTTPLSVVLGVLIVILVAWARLKTKNHTVGQVVLGALVSSLTVASVFWILK